MTPASTPCIDLCDVDPTSGLCRGCGRTLGEIAAWGGYTEPERLTVMAGLPERLARSRTAPRAAAGCPSNRRGAATLQGD